MQNAECEQIKTVDNCFYRSDCAETRSNGSRVYRGEQYDYVSRGRMQNDISVEEASLSAETEEENVVQADATEAAAEAARSETKAHLTSSVPRAARPPKSALSKTEMAEMRAIFGTLDDAEIHRLYKKVTNKN